MLHHPKPELNIPLQIWWSSDAIESSAFSILNRDPFDSKPSQDSAPWNGNQALHESVNFAAIAAAKHCLKSFASQN